MVLYLEKKMLNFHETKITLRNTTHNLVNLRTNIYNSKTDKLKHKLNNNDFNKSNLSS